MISSSIYYQLCVGLHFRKWALIMEVVDDQLSASGLSEQNHLSKYSLGGKLHSFQRTYQTLPH